MIYKPHNYQTFAGQHILDNPEAGLFIGMGLGKTVISLTAIDRLMFDEMTISKTLVVAPKKVTEHTWKAEIEKWNHIKHLRISIVSGTERERLQALRVAADIYAISRDNIAWLVGHYQNAFPFDMMVIDESSSFKNANSQRFKALRTVRPLVKRVVVLTGTPAPNGLHDLWSQIYLLDQGERLGKTLTSFRSNYFTEGNKTGHVVHNYNIRQDVNEDGTPKEPNPYEQRIYNKIGDICISMKAEDYLDLPKRIDRINEVILSPALKKQYNAFERDLILSLDTAEEITAMNAAGLTSKLLQFSNGAVYDADKVWHEVHREKLEALAEDMEAANGKPVLIFYSYKSDVERIQAHFKSYKPIVLKDGKDIDRWNRGEIQMLIAHPASAGHGLNLQYGGHLIEWFGPTWSLELYQQAVARLDRQGQTEPVINTRIICKGTIDEDVILALENKATLQDAVLEAVKARILKYKAND